MAGGDGPGVGYQTGADEQAAADDGDVRDGKLHARVAHLDQGRST